MKLSTTLFALFLSIIVIVNSSAQTKAPTPTPKPTPKDIFDMSDLGDYLSTTTKNPNLWNILKAPELMEQRKYDEAIKIFDEYLKNDAYSAYLLGYRALAYYYKKENVQALTDATASLKKNPGEVRALNVRAMIEIDHGQKDAAKKFFDLALDSSSKAIQAHPGSMDDYFARAETYRLMGENAKAAADYRKTLELTPNYNYAAEHLKLVTETKKPAADVKKPAESKSEVKFKEHAKEFDRLEGSMYAAESKAKKIEDALIADNKNNNRPQYFRNSGDTAICTALAEYETIFDKVDAETTAMSDMVESGEIDSDSALGATATEDAYAVIGVGGDILTRQLIWKCKTQTPSNIVEKPRAVVQKPVGPGAIEPPLPDLPTRVKTAIKKKNFDTIFGELNQILASNKKNADVLALRGDVYLAQKQTELARADYNQAIKLDSKNSLYYYKRGLSYQESPGYDLKAATADNDKALQLDPANSGALTEKGFNFNRANNIADAKAAFSAAVKSDPSNAPAYYQLGEIYLKENNAEAALDVFTRSIAGDPTYQYSYGRRASVYEFLKQNEKALADYTKIIEMYPKLEYGYGNRADFFMTIGAYGRAIEDLTKILSFTDTPDGYLRKRAEYQEIWGKYDEAIADYETYLKKNNWDAVSIKNYEALVAKANAARATAQAVSAVFNPALAAYEPLEKELGAKMDIYLALKKSKAATPTTGKSPVCYPIPDLKTLTGKAIVAITPIFQLYNDGKLKGFSEQIDYAEDRIKRLDNTKKMLEKDFVTFSCQNKIYYVE